MVLGGCTALAFTGREAVTHHDLKVGPSPSLVVDDDGGSVEVVPGPAGAIKIEARRHAATEKEALELPVTVALDGNTVRVRYHEEHHVEGHSVSFVIQAPPATRLQLSTGGGSIATRKMGAQQLHTGGGSIDATDLEGTVEAGSGGGSVHVTGRLQGACRVRTGGGSIAVAIPGDSRLTVDGATGGGSARNDFGLAVEGRGGKRMNGTIGDGRDGSLELRTGGGSLELARL
jgi:hypothetical protein